MVICVTQVSAMVIEALYSLQGAPKAFVLRYKFETRWALLGRLSRGFFLLLFFLFFLFLSKRPLILNIRFS